MGLKFAQSNLTFPPKAKFVMPTIFVIMLPKLFCHCNSFWPFPRVKYNGPIPKVNFDSRPFPAAQLSPTDCPTVPAIW